MAEYEGQSALADRPDNDTRELLLYGDRYSEVKAALYQIDSMRDYINKWTESLKNQAFSMDLGTKEICVGTNDNGEPIYEHIPIDTVQTIHDMLTRQNYTVIRQDMLGNEDIDSETPPTKILAGILNQIHRNFKALARLNEIEDNVKMYGRIGGARRYTNLMMSNPGETMGNYSIAVKMSNLDPINYESVRKSREQSTTYEELMRKFEGENGWKQSSI